MPFLANGLRDVCKGEFLLETVPVTIKKLEKLLKTPCAISDSSLV